MTHSSGKPNDKSNKQCYYVQGMHCPSCELLIEKEIKKHIGIDKVDVSLSKKCVEITSTSRAFPRLDQLNNKFSALGYTFYLEKPAEKRLNKKDVKKVLIIFTLFLFAFFALEKSGLFMRYSVSSTSSLFSYFIFGLLAGLSSCAALVGGLLLSLSGQWNALYNGNSTQSYIPFVYFNVSRIVAFALLGGLLGVLGSYISISVGFSTVVSLLISLLMLAIGFQMLNIGPFKSFKIALPKSISRYISNESNFKGKYMPLIAGALTFIVPCGFTLIAQTNAIASGSFASGALMLFAFSLGTLPMLALIGLSSVKFYSNPIFSKKFSLFSGLLITFFALYTINSQLNVLGLPSLNDVKVLASTSKHQAVESKIDYDESHIQLMQMEATNFQYYPSQLSIKAGVTTRWEIFNSGASGCAQAVYAHGLYPSVIYLKPGLNAVEFTPQKKGVYKVSCSMGMVPPITVNVY